MEETQDKTNPTGKYKSWYKESLTESEGWRKESSIDCGFYHGGAGQWNQKDLDKLEEESRPAITINRIKPTIDLQKGIEIRSRTDVDARPRKEEFAALADAITCGFKYIQDQNDADHEISDVFFDGLKAGIGWLEIHENDDPTEEEISISYRDWRRIGWDPYARDTLLDDARYMWFDKWVDLDIAEEMWPDKKDELVTAVVEQKELERKHGDQYAAMSYKYGGYENAEKVGWIDTARKRVRLCQMYYKKSEMATFIKMKDGEVHEIPEKVNDEQIAGILANPNVHKVIKKPVDHIYFVIFTGDVLLEEEKRSPYRHNHYPYIPFICYMDEDGHPYGMIRNMRDPQKEINANRSQYSHIIRTRRVFYEKGTVAKPNDAKREISRPDSWIELSPGALKNKQFQYMQDVAVAAEHFKIMQEAKQELQEISGAVEEQMGQETNARSGVAIEARQRQGATVNTEPFDNLRLTKRRMGQLLLSMMRQYWTYEKIVRITDEKNGSDKFVTFNQQLADGTVANDITQGNYDIVCAEHPETETSRNWMSRTLMDFASRMPPEIAITVLTAAFEMADLPNKENIVKRLGEAEQAQRDLNQQKLHLEAAKIDQQSQPEGGLSEAMSPT